MKKRRKFNISLLGESYVGKTCIINAFDGRMFDHETLRTIGTDTYYTKQEINNEEYRFKIYDTAGMEKYRSVSLSTIKFSDGYFIVFSVDDINSYKKIVDYIDYMEENFDLSEKTFYLIGNKVDVEPKKRAVTKEEAKEFAKSKKAKYFETSALTGEGIRESFNEMFQDIYKKYERIYKKKYIYKPLPNHYIINKFLSY